MAEPVTKAPAVRPQPEPIPYKVRLLDATKVAIALLATICLVRVGTTHQSMSMTIIAALAIVALALMATIVCEAAKNRGDWVRRYPPRKTHRRR